MQLADGLSVAAIALMVALSFVVGRKIAPNQHVPMQFAPGGAAVWSAPRWIALSFLPFLALAFDIMYVVLSSGESSPHTLAEILVLASLRIPTIVIFVVVHTLYLYAVIRWIAGQL